MVCDGKLWVSKTATSCGNASRWEKAVTIQN